MFLQTFTLLCDRLFVRQDEVGARDAHTFDLIKLFTCPSAAAHEGRDGQSREEGPDRQQK